MNQILQTISAKELSCSQPVCRNWIIERLIGHNTVSAVAGSAKAGKTHFCMQMAHAIAAGVNFFDMKTKRSEVLYIMMDSDRDEVIERLSKNCYQDELLLYAFPDNLVLGNRGLPAGAVTLESFLEQVREEHPDLQVVFLDMFDNIRLVNERTENSNTIVKEDICCLKKIGKKQKLNFVLLMHTRKQKTDNPYSSVLGGMQTTGALNGSFIRLIRDEIGSTVTRAEIGGRNTAERVLNLTFDTRTLQFKTSNAVEVMDPVIGQIRNFIILKGEFQGTIGELCSRNNIALSARKVSSLLKMNRAALESEGVFFSALPKTHAGVKCKIKCANYCSEKVTISCSGWGTGEDTFHGKCLPLYPRA